MDIAMPGPNGWEVARQLRERGFDQLVIIVISANPHALHQPTISGRYHNEIMTKPVSIPDLLNKISFLLQLEWLVQGAEPPVETPASVENTLDRAKTEALRQLAAIGYVRGIHAKLDSLEQDDPTDAPYIAHLRRLIAEFQIDAFVQALGPEADGE